MELLKETNSGKWYLVKKFTTRAGLEARIQQMVWNRELMPDLSLHDHYTGYVRVPEGDTKVYYDSELEVHGGITYENEINGEEGRWVGFDMAHLGDEHIPRPLEYAENECEKLAEKILTPHTEEKEV